MARYNNRYNYYGRNRYYGRTRNYYRRGNTRSKSWGNMKAARQQADQATVTINVPSTLACKSIGSQDPLDTSKTIKFGVFPLNIFESLRKSEFFASYSNMYDEFKIDRVKVKLLPTEFTYLANSGEGRYRNVTVYTAWDRTGLNANQLRLLATHLTSSSTVIGIKEGNTHDGDGLYCCIGEDIATYSSAESRTVNPGTNTNIVRWLSPKTMQEKSQWISTSTLKKWYSEFLENEGCFIGIPTGRKDSNKLLVSDGDVNINVDIQAPGMQGEAATQIINLNTISSLNSNNPCFLLEDSGIKFKPTLLVGVYPMENNNACKFNVETEVVVTFRGLRKATVVGA